MELKVLLVNGSPHKAGCTYTAQVLNQKFFGLGTGRLEAVSPV